MQVGRNPWIPFSSMSCLKHSQWQGLIWSFRILPSRTLKSQEMEILLLFWANHSSDIMVNNYFFMSSWILPCWNLRLSSFMFSLCLFYLFLLLCSSRRCAAQVCPVAIKVSQKLLIQRQVYSAFLLSALNGCKSSLILEGAQFELFSDSQVWTLAIAFSFREIWLIGEFLTDPKLQNRN